MEPNLSRIIMKKWTVFLALFVMTFGYSQNWKTNFEETKQQATKENKNIL